MVTSRSPARPSAIQLDADDVIQRCAIGLIGLGSTPERAETAEAAARRPSGRRTSSPKTWGGLAMAGLDIGAEDLHGSAAYRTRVGGAMVARAWTTARRGGAPWMRYRCGAR